MMLRRARAATGLLLAAAGVAFVATVLLAGLIVFGRAVAEAGTHSVVASADPADRSILVRGTPGRDAATLDAWDAALRRTFGGGLGGVPATVRSAGYGAGWALAEPTGRATPNASGVAYASVMHLEGLAAHARLIDGAWPTPGASPVRAALAEPVAAALGVRPGDRIPLADRRTGRITRVEVAGVWRPETTTDAYWRLAPDVFTGVAPQSATYGPVVVDRADFLRHFAVTASVGWLVEPDLRTAGRAEVARVGAAASAAGTGLPASKGLDQSAAAETGLPGLATRLTRADLVGRSALVTPMLLVAVLGAYALLLVALLLAEHRRGETALLRARGAARGQLGGLAVREALLVVLPAALLAPPAAAALVTLAGRTPMLSRAMDLQPRLDAPAWLVGVLAAAGCAVAIAIPALRRGRTYTAELAQRSRPTTRSIMQRVGLDLVLAALAVLGWLQLRQYASPLSRSGSDGTLGIDPLLAAAPTLGVVAGAVLSLRLLAPAARLVGRFSDRLSGGAAVLGTWQAGRRAHAGPMVLVALAVAAGTVSWCLAGTSRQSAVDQADQLAGADLRLVEVSGAAPAGRAEQLARAAGVTEVLPAWRYQVPLGSDGESGDLVALDAAAASRVVPIRDDVAGGDPAAMFRRLAAGRSPVTGVALPAGTTRLAGTIQSTEAGVTTTLLLTEASGGHRRIPLDVGADGRFSVPLPASGTPPRLAGFLVYAPEAATATLTWRLTELNVPVGAGWQTADLAHVGPAGWSPLAGLAAIYPMPPRGAARFAVVPAAKATPVPVVATPDALAGLRLRVGENTTLALAGAAVDVTIAGTVSAVPGTGGGAGLLADLPSLSARLLERRGVAPAPQEWWLSTADGVHGATLGIDGVRVVDRRALAAAAAGEAYGVGAWAALFGAAIGAMLLAAAGMAVDVQATTRRRAAELAVLHTLGAGPRLLARSLVVEQAFLAGIGALVGLFAGVLVAGAMAPLLVLTPAATRPVPVPLLAIDWPRVTGTGLALLVVALGLSALTGVTMNRRLAVARLRIGADQ